MITFADSSVSEETKVNCFSDIGWTSLACLGVRLFKLATIVFWLTMKVWAVGSVG